MFFRILQIPLEPVMAKVFLLFGSSGIIIFHAVEKMEREKESRIDQPPGKRGKGGKVLIIGIKTEHVPFIRFNIMKVSFSCPFRQIPPAMIKHPVKRILKVKTAAPGTVVKPAVANGAAVRKKGLFINFRVG